MENTRNRPPQGQSFNKDQDKKGLGQSKSDQHSQGQQKQPMNQPKKTDHR
ncbi:hypothetical protein BN59_03558 [Legionella massiliensis]|uniref:Uncharacterized protein n=1 Tax=Legionella massiliensis TaxID=1034943 RepID=A0A078KXT9_9GAMM|nr:hypothetical protein [Legionella massiliensis]CDZ79240.1 hypothetical protein BN59_03558 [Legionella massiliensis]CEE14978.1 hypothetical protein BN1094_03558 [Legionella massiliensis]